MKEILKRLKNPVVITELISIIGTLVIVFLPNSAEPAAAAVIAAAIAVINAISGTSDKK